MLTKTNRMLAASALALAGFLLVTPSHAAKAQVLPVEEEDPTYQGCSPCTTNTGGDITHSWAVACCWNTSGCYWYPDAQLHGNPGSCPGMHRPCDG